MSGIGKGVVASSTGMLLKAMGVRVTSIKIDPYINIDAGTMSPFEHGEVFVLADGGEVDLDLGNYERFLDCTLGRENNVTTGKVYQRVIAAERHGRYLGKTVQVVPHICDEIQHWLERVAEKADAEVCIVELGGTVGDIEGMPFVEALRQLAWRVGRANFVDMHVSLVPVAVDEQKTKPTQTTVGRLRQLGLQPDLIMCRSSAPLTNATKSKIAMFCQLDENRIIGVHDVSNLYGVPLLLEEQGLCNVLVERLGLTPKHAIPQLDTWRALSATADRLATLPEKDVVRIAFVGKYIELKDAYKSLIKAMTHAGLACDVRHELVFVDSSLLSDKKSGKPGSAEAWQSVRTAHAVLVPGGFGVRGVGGKLAAIKYARENRVPYLGICLGMQLAVVEAARSQVGWLTAGSEEFDSSSSHYDDEELRLSRELASSGITTELPGSVSKKDKVSNKSGEDSDSDSDDKLGSNQKNVIIFMPEISKTHMGGTMRLGERRTIISDGKCIAAELYGSTEVLERHRHRYEVDPSVVDEIEAKSDLRFVGRDDSGQRMEIVEISREKHPFFVGVQFHPEFTSRPLRPGPLFVGFMRAAQKQKAEQEAKN